MYEQGESCVEWQAYISRMIARAYPAYYPHGILRDILASMKCYRLRLDCQACLSSIDPYHKWAHRVRELNQLDGNSALQPLKSLGYSPMLHQVATFVQDVQTARGEDIER
jgi:hypothetical protein